MKTLILTFCLFFITNSFALGRNNGDFYHGEIHLRGKITQSACHIAMKNSNQIVKMGQLRTNQFSGLGTLSDAVPFEINFHQCENDVSIIFLGVSDSKDPQVLKAGRGVNSAIGVGLAIFDLQGNIIPPDSAPKKIDINNSGETVLRFIARYRATSLQVVGGNADAWTEFKLSYY